VEYLIDSWSLVVILLSAFAIGWGAEAAQTFMPRALALTILAWLQTAPEFAVEAAIAWSQQRDLMIANLTGSLRLLLGLGWPLIFFVHFASQLLRGKPGKRLIQLEGEDALTVLFLFLSVLYFIFILAKGQLNCWDSLVLGGIYGVYLYLSARLPVHEVEDVDDMPWVSRKIVALPSRARITATVLLFVAGGLALYFSVHPFIGTLQKWSIGLGISTFVFVQWVAPFLSEFPEKVTAFNWARQDKKAPMAVMNMVNSNLNQWTMLAAMIPLVFSLSLGRFEAVVFDDLHSRELALTIAQSFLGGLLLLDLKFSLLDASLILVLWLVQFLHAPLREEITVVYLIWSAALIARFAYFYAVHRKLPRAIHELRVMRLDGTPRGAV